MNTKSTKKLNEIIRGRVKVILREQKETDNLKKEFNKSLQEISSEFQKLENNQFNNKYLKSMYLLTSMGAVRNNIYSEANLNKFNILAEKLTEDEKFSKMAKKIVKINEDILKEKYNKLCSSTYEETITRPNPSAPKVFEGEGNVIGKLFKEFRKIYNSKFRLF